MKFFYGFVLGISVLLLVMFNLMSVAAFPDETAARRLAARPEAWELVLKDRKAGEDAAEAKGKLIGFIQQTPDRGESAVAMVNLGLLVAVVFSLIGSATEIQRQQRLARWSET